MWWLKRTLQGMIIVLLVAAILGITAGTLMPVIYRTDWFQHKYVNPSSEK